MKLTRTNNAFSLTVEWRNAILPMPERGKVEAEYGRTMIVSAGNSIDSLRDIHAAACRDCANMGGAYHDWLKRDAIARANAFKGLGLFPSETKQAAFSLTFKREVE